MTRRYRQIELEEHKALRWRPPPAGELDGASSDDGSVVGSLLGGRESDDGSVASLASSVSRFSSAQSLASTAASQLAFACSSRFRCALGCMVVENVPFFRAMADGASLREDLDKYEVASTPAQRGRGPPRTGRGPRY